MSEIHVTLPAPQLEAVKNGATMLVRRTEPQPRWSTTVGGLPDGCWVWRCFCWTPGNQPHSEIFRHSPFGRPGDVLVVRFAIEANAGYDPMWVRKHFGDEQSKTLELRLHVLSVAVRRLGELTEEDYEKLGEHPMDFMRFYNSFNPDHPWNVSDHVWVAEVKR